MTKEQKAVTDKFHSKYAAEIIGGKYMGRRGFAILPSAGNKNVKFINEDGFDVYGGGKIELENGKVFMSYAIKLE